jgi:hypothetical protein
MTGIFDTIDFDYYVYDRNHNFPLFWHMLYYLIFLDFHILFLYLNLLLCSLFLFLISFSFLNLL